MQSAVAQACDVATNKQVAVKLCSSGLWVRTPLWACVCGCMLLVPAVVFTVVYPHMQLMS